MSRKTTQAIASHAEEYGQSRQYAKQEAVALFVLAVLAGLWAGLSVLVVGAAYFLYTERGFWTAFFVLAVPVGVLVGGGLVILKGAREQLDGLRSFRQATTFQPVQPQPEPEAEYQPPIVRPYKGDPYLLHRDGRTTPLLPDGRQAGLALNPPTVGAILREIVERHDGQWSRDRLMSIRVDGKRVTRKLYERLTYYLSEGGFLQKRPTGGFEIPPDVATYEDVTRYLPSLSRPEGGNPTRTAGRSDGRQEQGGDNEAQPDGGGAGTLAQRRQELWRECGCDVTAYLERRSNHDENS